METLNNEDILIKISNLKFKYNKKQKEHNVDIDKLEIQENQIISLLGPSGSGKTTLLNLILGYLKPNEGSIEIKNKPLIYEIAYIMQENSTYEDTTVFNNVFLSAKNYSKWVDSARLKYFENLFSALDVNAESNKKLFSKFEVYKQYIASGKQSNLKKKIAYLSLVFSCLNNKNIKGKSKVLSQIRLRNLFRNEINDVAKKLEIDHLLHKRVDKLSGGQKQRVAFAKGIIKKTNLVLMDEPFSALDAKIKESTIEWLIKIKREFDLSIIIVTHDQQDALKLSDQIILLKDGKVQQYSSGDRMYDSPNNLFVAKFIGAPEINFVNTKDGKHYYIRQNKLKVDLNKDGAYSIQSKKNFGDKTYYQIEYNDNNIWTIVLKDSTIEVNDKVDITFSDADVLVFDDEGNRVYA
ncbi:ATP-binding cassette domain-containing protein [Mycoplasmopsis bovis]|uniref:ATP-binding cassette domain-containing protein n=1 Tax=Mycoplasmopsis bovis TaxID=28903 RepID=UPI00094ADF95|nr:ABC transporter ATP-binding protein [Mycoplasmopsis bovis]